jgi:hypothetical protein
MDAKQEIKLARAQLAEALDAKLENDPIWKAFRAMDRALESFESAPVRQSKPAFLMSDGTSVRLVPTYTLLAKRAITSAGRPLTTPELMDFIGRNRKLGQDPEKAKVNVTSSLSKDKRFRSVPWENGRAWWYGSDDPPKPERLADLLVSEPSE